MSPALFSLYEGMAQWPQAKLVWTPELAIKYLRIADTDKRREFLRQVTDLSNFARKETIRIIAKVSK